MTALEARMLYLHALSPVHTGTGQGTGVIDLPVARETTTGWPYIPGSSIKGVLRARCTPSAGVTGAATNCFEEAFGPPTERASDGAGALTFADGRLLCLPVRSLFGTFAWVTCPLALDRYRRDHATSRLPMPPVMDLAALHTDSPLSVVVAADSMLADRGTVYLEDLDLQVVEAQPAAMATHIASSVFDDPTWQEHFRRRFAVVSDTTFSFLAEVGTEVDARIQIDEDRKTAKDGHLWYEEAIPAESIFSAPVLAVPRNGTKAGALYELLVKGAGGVVQIGGHASVGRGLMEIKLVGGAQ
jgi:CRISPR-associated protein Cmr4